jgi:hypothetical protein
MYGVAVEKRPIFVESDDFLYNLGDPNIRNNIGSTRLRCFEILLSVNSYIKIPSDFIIISMDRVVQLYPYVVSMRFLYLNIVPPESPYIIIPPVGIIIYERVGQYRGDPNIRNHGPPISIRCSTLSHIVG